MSGTRGRTSFVFLDTHVLIAAINRGDARHRAAVALLPEFSDHGTPLVAGDWVLAEFLSAAARPRYRAAATAWVAAMPRSPLLTLVPADRSTWLEAFKLFQQAHDKGWSLVDCTTIVLCRRQGITRVATNDRHFVQAGFEILLP